MHAIHRYTRPNCNNITVLHVCVGECVCALTGTLGCVHIYMHVCLLCYIVLYAGIGCAYVCACVCAYVWGPISGNPGCVPV